MGVAQSIIILIGILPEHKAVHDIAGSRICAVGSTAVVASDLHICAKRLFILPAGAFNRSIGIREIHLIVGNLLFCIIVYSILFLRLACSLAILIEKQRMFIIMGMIAVDNSVVIPIGLLFLTLAEIRM